MIFSKKKVEDLKAELLSTHEQLSNLEEEHYQEVTMFKKKIQYLTIEHQSKVNGIKFEIENHYIIIFFLRNSDKINI